MLVAHIAPVLVLSVTLNIPKFLESEVSKNGDDDDDDDDDDVMVMMIMCHDS